MYPIRIVVDTNVLYAALYSKRGASFALLSLIDAGLFEVQLSVLLVLEYEEVALKNVSALNLSLESVYDILDYVCIVGRKHKIYYLWRPFLRDPEDEMLLDLAVKSAAHFIVTYNIRDLSGTSLFGVKVVTPYRFLEFLSSRK